MRNIAKSRSTQRESESSISRSHVSPDPSLQIKVVEEKWSLRIEIPKARFTKKISAVVLKGKIQSVNLKSARAEPLIRGPNIRSQDQQSHQIARSEGVHILKS
jgi:hypothetical protein